jgi:hypothetical protein
VPRSIEVLVPPEDLPVLQHISSRSKPLCQGTRPDRAAVAASLQASILV